MLEYINCIKRYFRDHYKAKVIGGSKESPNVEIDDGTYLCRIRGRNDMVKITDGKIACCNFVEEIKHPDVPKGWDGSIKKLAVAIEQMRYDKVAVFLKHLEDALEARSKRDEKDDKRQLAKRLKTASKDIGNAKISVQKAWKICKKYMEN